MPSTAPVADPVAELIAGLLADATRGSAALTAYFVAFAAHLPEDDAARTAMVRDRWPALSEDELRTAFTVAAGVLRGIEREAASAAAMLETMGAAGGSA